MTTETLIKANELNRKIILVEKLLQNTENQKADWIEFTFGNGSNRASVCSDKDQIEIVKSLLVSFHQKELLFLKQELESL